MRPPRRPPFENLIVSSPAVWKGAVALRAKLDRRAYPHWDDLVHRTPPEGATHEEWWLAHKLGRQGCFPVPLKDLKGRPFTCDLPDIALELLLRVDTTLAGKVGLAQPVLTKENRDRLVFSSLAEEAITSSQLEGAATTRQVAKEMIRAGREPRDLSERMILNNFRAMERVRDLTPEPLTQKVVLDLHRTLTLGTLADEADAGRIQLHGEDRVGVWDEKNERLHDPPPAKELPARMAAMCAFANGETPSHFVHPVVRAILLHFWLAYDHPFVDGNGRTARALFYWSMMRHGYWLAEFAPISSVLRKAPGPYGRSFLLVETDENDLTYFLLHQLEVLRKAIEQFEAYVKRKTHEQEETGHLLRDRTDLNHRQIALLGHALKSPGVQYTIESHRASHRITYETARTDLLGLAELELLEKRKQRRTFVFVAPEDLPKRVKGRGKRR